MASIAQGRENPPPQPGTLTLAEASPRLATMALGNRRSRPRSPALWAAAAALAVALAGPAASDAPPADPQNPNAASAVRETARSKRLREINVELERQQERLIELIAAPPTATAPPLRENPELRALAVSLPRLQEERRRLQEPQDPPAPAAPETP